MLMTSVAAPPLEARLLDAQLAAARRKSLQAERGAACGRVFDAIVGEQQVLETLCAPLTTRLANSTGTLCKLSFSVSRWVDADKRGKFAEEELIECRGVRRACVIVHRGQVKTPSNNGHAQRQSLHQYRCRRQTTRPRGAVGKTLHAQLPITLDPLARPSTTAFANCSQVNRRPRKRVILHRPTSLVRQQLREESHLEPTDSTAWGEALTGLGSSCRGPNLICELPTQETSGLSQ